MRAGPLLSICLGVGIALCVVACSDNHQSASVAVIPTRVETPRSGGAVVATAPAPEAAPAGNLDDGLPEAEPGGLRSSATKVEIWCDQESLPKSVLEVRGFLRSDADKRWRIGDELLRTDELERYLVARAADLKPAGILVQDRDKRDCHEFDSGRAVIVEFCARYNVDLFVSIPNAFKSAAVWVVQARPLTPAAQELRGALSRD